METRTNPSAPLLIDHGCLAFSIDYRGIKMKKEIKCLPFGFPIVKTILQGLSGFLANLPAQHTIDEQEHYVSFRKKRNFIVMFWSLYNHSISKKWSCCVFPIYSFKDLISHKSHMQVHKGKPTRKICDYIFGKPTGGLETSKYGSANCTAHVKAVSSLPVMCWESFYLSVKWTAQLRAVTEPFSHF